MYSAQGSCCHQLTRSMPLLLHLEVPLPALRCMGVCILPSVIAVTHRMFYPLWMYLDRRGILHSVLLPFPLCDVVESRRFLHFGVCPPPHELIHSWKQPVLYSFPLRAYVTMLMLVVNSCVPGFRFGSEDLDQISTQNVRISRTRLDVE
jgi:hypothetical protein